MFDPYIILGMKYQEAEALANTNGYTVRMEVEDGMQCGGCLDYDNRRINVEVEDSFITMVIDIG